MNSTKKKERFVRLAEKRVNNAVKALSLISNLSNTSNYEFNSKQIKSMMNVLDREFKDLKTVFNRKLNKKKTFKLDE